MAGDWIKMRSNLWDDPRVSRLCDLTDQGEAAVIGGLYWLWAAADQHTETGVMTGLSLRQIDRKTGIPGFGQALCDIGWIEECDDGIRIVNFEEHNGASAKRRTLEAKRKADARKASARNADNKETETGRDAELEKEKERELEKELKDGSAADAGGESTKKSTRKKPAKPIPDDFFPDATSKAKALECGLNLGAELDKFRNHAQANDRRQADWQAAFRMWLSKAREWRGGQQHAVGNPGPRKELTLD